jgi:serine/threonine protein kinase
MIAVGTRLGPYEILSQLGSGGMGEVYHAKDTRLDRIVAIKALPAQVSDRSHLRQVRAGSAKTGTTERLPMTHYWATINLSDLLEYPG